MRILVTGGAGFIGSHLCDALLARGDYVICLDNFNNYYSPARKKKNVTHNLTNPNFKLYSIDIKDEKKLKDVFIHEDIECVIHLAAKAGVRHSIQFPQQFQEDNNKGTMNLLELSKDFGIKKFVFGSSSSVYGNNKKVPFSEEDVVDYPISPYAATKKAGELMVHTYSHLHGFNAICLRFFTVYGPRGRPDMAPYKFTKLISNDEILNRYGDGTTARDYTYVADIVQGIIGAVDADIKFEIINLGNSSPVKLNEFIATVEKHVGKKAKIIQTPIPPGDVQITYADISKAKRLLGYDPKISFDEGIRRLVEWYKENNGTESVK